jgi:imidazolonepropionase-like amidohydrolase
MCDSGSLTSFASRPRNPILIEGGTLIDGTGADARPNKALLIHGDEIVAMGERASEQARGLESQGLQRLDATGQFVLPGLIDAHCHVTFAEPQSNDEMFFHRQSEGLTAIIAAHNVKKLLLAGCTGFLDADVMYNCGADVRDAIEIGAIPGPRMSTGGNALLTAVGGTAGRLIPEEGLRGYAQVVNNKDEIVQIVRRQIKHGVDWIKLHITGLVPRQLQRGELTVWSPEEIRLAVETAHALHTPVVAHVRSAGSCKDAALNGVDLLLHATNMDDEAVEAVIKSGAAIAPTLAFQANLADYGEACGASPPLIEIFRKEIESSSVSLKQAYDAGVPFLCGSETGFSLTPIGHWHGRELEVFVKHLGMTPMQAITCATKEGARCLRLYGRVGTLEEGMLADVIVVDSDPLKDIRVLNNHSHLKQVVSKGQLVDLGEPWPTRGLWPGEKVGNWTTRPLTQEVAASLQK